MSVVERVGIPYLAKGTADFCRCRQLAFNGIGLDEVVLNVLFVLVHLCGRKVVSANLRGVQKKYNNLD